MYKPYIFALNWSPKSRVQLIHGYICVWRSQNLINVHKTSYSGFQLTLAALVWKCLGNLGTTLQNSRFHCYCWQSNCELWNENHEFDLEVRFEICELRFQVGKAAVGMACAEEDESDKSWLSTFKHQIDLETFTWINFVAGSKLNFDLLIREDFNLMFNSAQFTRQTETGQMLHEKWSGRMLFQKGRKKEDKLDTVRNVKIRWKTVFLSWLWPLFT